MTLPAFAAERRRLQHGARSYFLPAGRWATNPPASVAAVDRWDRRTDGRTPDRYKDPAEHTGSVNNNVTGAVRTQNRNYKNETDRPNAEIS